MSNLDAEMAELNLELDNWDFGSDSEDEGVREEAVKRVRGRNKSKPKKCRHCGETDPDKLYRNYYKKQNVIYLQNVCKVCRSQISSQRSQNRRKSGSFVENFILIDSRRFDKKRGLRNDLTLDFICSEISKGCSYCGDVNIRMTLDRVDNSIGHLMSNVVPACIRCNYIRRDMPYQAWNILVPRIREVFKKGLFGDWVCRARRSK